MLTPCVQVPEGVDLGAPVIAVDYDDVDALQAVLEKHEINTVISALALHIIGVGSAQINLIKAADKSEPTKRFVTSTWAVRPELKYVTLYHLRLMVRYY
jgi:saccharopine dehydrogenase-like NADP-dependent oxidoreductase